MFKCSISHRVAIGVGIGVLVTARIVEVRQAEITVEEMTQAKGVVAIVHLDQAGFAVIDVSAKTKGEGVPDFA